MSNAPLKWSPPTCLAGREVAGSPPGVYLCSLLISSAADFSAANPERAGITDKEGRTAATAASRLTLKTRLRDASRRRVLPPNNLPLTSANVRGAVWLSRSKSRVNPFRKPQRGRG